MKRAAVAAVWIASVAGCGGASDEADPIVGVWMLEDEPCVAAFVFSVDGTYEYRYACDSGDDQLNLELYKGDYRLEGDALHLEPLAGTCAPEDSAGAADSAAPEFAITDGGERLRLYGSSGTAVFERRRDDGSPSSGGVIVFGCYLDGGFLPQAISRY